MKHLSTYVYEKLKIHKNSSNLIVSKYKFCPKTRDDLIRIIEID